MAYAAVLARWSKKIKPGDKISDADREAWTADLRKALEQDLVAKLKEDVTKEWAAAKLPIPSDETLDRFAKTAAKKALGPDAYDLLSRLPTFTDPDTAQEALDVLTAASPWGFVIKRSVLAVSQMFDMAADAYNATIGRFFQKSGALTGRRQWHVTSVTKKGTQSRHESLDGQIRNEGESFEFKGESVYGPRPPGGSPAHWSNCSCYLTYEKENGDWVSRS